MATLGLGYGIIQNKELNRQEIYNIFPFAILIGTLSALIFLGFCPLIAAFYHIDIFSKIGIYAVPIIILNSGATFLSSILIRDLRFKAIGITEIIVNLISGILVILLAYWKFGIYALLYKDIIQNLILLIIYWYISGYRFKFNLGFNSIRKIFYYAIHQSGAEATIYLSRNLDNLLVGKFLGDQALGFYDRAFRLMQYPIYNLVNIIAPVFHATLSNYQHNKAIILQTYQRIMEITGTIAFPLTAFLFFSGKEIILLIYGRQWYNSIVVFQILSLTYGFQFLHAVTGPIFRAINKTDLLLKIIIIYTILIITGIIIGLPFGIFGVSCGFSIGVSIGSCIFVYCLIHQLGGTIRSILFRLGKSGLTGIVLGLILYLVNIGFK